MPLQTAPVVSEPVSFNRVSEITFTYIIDLYDNNGMLRYSLSVVDIEHAEQAAVIWNALDTANTGKLHRTAQPRTRPVSELVLLKLRENDKLVIKYWLESGQAAEAFGNVWGQTREAATFEVVS